jgi:hypothetical protein
MKTTKRYNRARAEQVFTRNGLTWTHPSAGIYRVLGMDYYPHKKKTVFRGEWIQFESPQEFVDWLQSDCKQQPTTMKDPEQQDMVRDLETYKDRIREIKTQLVELEGMIMSDYFQRNKKKEHE